MNISLQSKNEFLTKMIIHFYRGWQWTKSDNDLIMQHQKPFPEPIVHYGVAFVRKIVRRTTLTFGEKLHQFFLSDCFSETCWNADQPPHIMWSPGTWWWSRTGPCLASDVCGKLRGHGTARGGWGRSSRMSGRIAVTSTPGGQPRSSQCSLRSPGNVQINPN